VCLLALSGGALAGCGHTGGGAAKAPKTPVGGGESIERSEEAAQKREEDAELSRDRELLAGIEAKKREEDAEVKAKKLEKSAQTKAKKREQEVRKLEKETSAKAKAREEAIRKQAKLQEEEAARALAKKPTPPKKPQPKKPQPPHTKPSTRSGAGKPSGPVTTIVR
jgi:hypothetical protein